MELLQVALTTLLSVVALFLLTKLMGEKQISQMSMFDYIIGITIGSIAAELATELEAPLRPLLAMVLYALLAVLTSILTAKSLNLRKLITGRPILLMDNGKLYRSNFKKARMDMSDFLTLCRFSGYFDLSQIQTAILEHNGAMSFLPVSTQRPATPGDLKITPAQERLPTTVILDGHILAENVKQAGQNAAWLMKQLKQQGFASPKEVFFAAIDSETQLAVYPMITRKRPVDPFE